MLKISRTLAGAIVDAVSDNVAGLEETVKEYKLRLKESSQEQIPLNYLEDFFSSATEHASNPDIGLQAYKRAHPGNIGILGYALMSSPNIEMALKQIVDNYNLLGTGFCMHLEDHKQTLRLICTTLYPNEEKLSRTFIDAIASITLGLLDWLSPSVNEKPISVEFTYPKPTNLEKLHAVFGNNIKFSSRVNAMDFSRKYIESKVATYNPSLQKIHYDLVKNHYSEVIEDKATSKVERIIFSKMNQSQSFDLESIAKSMCMSTYQLSRKLEAEGISFHKILDTVKAHQSKHLLSNTTISIKEISYYLGFKNQSAFNKACYRWFGISPGLYRDKNRQ